MQRLVWVLHWVVFIFPYPVTPHEMVSALRFCGHRNRERAGWGLCMHVLWLLTGGRKGPQKRPQDEMGKREPTIHYRLSTSETHISQIEEVMSTIGLSPIGGDDTEEM